MSSTNKTQNLRLNSWIGSDKPKRTDFNADNEIIDSVVSTHINDIASHITEEERRLWNSFSYSGVYFGDGSVEKTVNFDVNFDVRCVIVFANNRPSSIVKFDNNRNYNYFAVASRSGNMLGVRLSSDCKSMVVRQDPTAQLFNEVASFNEVGVSYTYILLR